MEDNSKEAKSDVQYLIAQDMLRYGLRKRLTLLTYLRYFYIEVIPGLKFSVIFRYCQYYRRRNRLLFYFYYLRLRRIKTRYGIDISYRTKIGKGLYIGHSGGIVVHGDAEIGEYCNLSQGMTIGVSIRGKQAGVPKIGNRVFIGPSAVILGDIRIGNEVLIGANSIVTFDVPDKAVVASPLASIISDKGSADYIMNTE